MALEKKDFSAFAKQVGHRKRCEKTKEVIYAAALLHDMGKWKQYEAGVDHAQAGEQFCRKVLKDCGFSDGEIEIIADAILNHRKKGKNLSEKFLSRILALADTHSRLCFRCPVVNECKWQERRAGKFDY